MFIMDVPNIPAQEPPLIVADASVSQNTAQPFDRVIGVCHLSESPFVPLSAVNSMSPPLEVKSYFRNKEHLKVEGAASVSVLQMPAHGALVDDGDGDYVYLPEKVYLGNDRASLLVEMGGKKVRMEYFFRVLQQVPDQEGIDGYADNCPNKVRVWKISSTTDTNGNTILAAVDFQSLAVSANRMPAINAGSATTLDAAALNAVLGTNALSNLAGNFLDVNFNLADLSGAALGQTTGSSAQNNSKNK